MAEALFVAIVFAAPLTLSAPAVQARTITCGKVTVVAVKLVTDTKAAKVCHQKHYGKHKVFDTGSTRKK